MTEENQAVLRDMGRALISRCPGTFRVVDAAKAAAWAADQWIPVGTVAERRHAAHYHAYAYRATIGDVPYRLVVYRSSALDTRNVHPVDREIAEARRALARAADAGSTASRPSFSHGSSA